MNIALTVVEDFLTHIKGEIISDAKLVEQYLVSEYQDHFVKTAAPAAAAPAVAPAAASAAPVPADAAAK